MYNIVVIGIGNLGIRHFQALLNCNVNLKIYLVDTLESSLNRAKEMLTSAKDVYRHDIKMVGTMDELPKIIDIAIVATSSNIRSKVIKELLSEDRNVEYLILEKVLFQTIQEYAEIDELLTKKNVSTWVNCPRRMMDGHKEIKRRLEKDDIHNVVITGGDWGLGCNSIHIIDLISFFVGKVNSLTISSKMLDPEILKSKRDGYIEFTGSLFGEINEEITFIIRSNKNSSEPIEMYFFCENNNIIIRENEDVADIIYKGVSEKIDLHIKYQSELTNLVVEKLIKYGDCELTPYKISSKLHLPLIKSFLNHQKKHGNGDGKICKIT